MLGGFLPVDSNNECCLTNETSGLGAPDWGDARGGTGVASDQRYSLTVPNHTNMDIGRLIVTI